MFAVGSVKGKFWSFWGATALLAVSAGAAMGQTVTVNTLADENDGITTSIAALINKPGGTGISLREAITAANNTVSTSKTIIFSVIGDISIGSALPAISSANLTIDGDDKITLEPSRFIIGTVGGLVVTADAVEILDLTIQGFSGPGISVSGNPIADEFVVAGCVIEGNGGTATNGLGSGILLSNVSGAVIGGKTKSGGNIIGGNSSFGVALSLGTLDGVTIENNYIGAAANGRSALPNGIDGIRVGLSAAAEDTTIRGNLISGNDASGIRIGSSSTGTSIQDNIIGLDSLGDNTLPNGEYGIRVSLGVSTDIGGTSAADANTISGNGLCGILVDSSGGGTTSTSIQGNKIGTNSAGTVLRGNGQHGIEVINGALQTSIGGTAAGAGNVIAGNGVDGVRVTASNRANIRRNSIYSNSGQGIRLQSGGNSSMIRPVISRVSVSENAVFGTVNPSQGTQAIELFEDSADEGRTYIASTTSLVNGEWVLGSLTLDESKFYTATTTNSTGNTSEFSLAFVQAIEVDTFSTTIDGSVTSPFALLGNPGTDGFISLNEAVAAANNQGGVSISFKDASGTISPSGALLLALTSNYNRIDGGGGVLLSGASAGAAANGLRITGDENHIEGLGFSGWQSSGIKIESASQTTVLGCEIVDCAKADGAGIYITTGSMNTYIGDGTEDGANFIYACFNYGIRTAGTQTLVRGNTIGLQPDGQPGANSGTGILIEGGTTFCIIGGDEESDGNVISLNDGHGIEVLTGAGNTTIQNNIIGTNSEGKTPLGNDRSGVRATGVANLVVSDNLISANDEYGVTIEGASTNAQVLRNRIGTDSSGVDPLGNTLSGLRISGSSTGTVAGASLSSGDFADANTIAHNGQYGIRLSGSASGNTWRGNAIFANGSGGIIKDGSTLNGGINPPQVDSVDVGAGTMSGDCDPDALIDFYFDDGVQAEEYFATTQCGDMGDWQITGVDFSELDSRRIGIIQTDDANNSSAIRTHSTSITVNTLTDTADGTQTSLGDLMGTPGSGGLISLREALAAASAQDGPKRIVIGTVGTISPTSVLTPISSGDLWLDGGGARIDGAAIPNAGTVGLSLLSSGNVIENLTITRFTGPGIRVDAFGSADGNIIRGCNIGTDGTADLGNGGAGIQLEDAVINTLIGGTEPGHRNVISGNAGSGIQIGGTGNADNLIIGNYIGVNAAGTGAIPNDGNGIHFSGTSVDTIVGGAEAAERNVISGNGQNGVLAGAAGVAGLRLFNNYLGTNAAGTGALPNGQNGFTAAAGGDFGIGGLGEGEGNLISGNGGGGVSITGAASPPHLIAGNIIGTNAAGTAALANQGTGLRFSFNASGHTVSGNQISGNAGDGIELGGSAADNVITDNIIGANAAGTAAVPNTGSGIRLLLAPSTVIGQVGAGNVISGNTGNGIVFEPTAALPDAVFEYSSTLKANRIGTSLDGQSAVPNGGAGISVLDGSSMITIGGIAAGEGNVISGNGDTGVLIIDLTESDESDTTGITLAGNIIGAKAADYTGLRLFASDALGNQSNGVTIGGSFGNTVGGTTIAHANIIAFNGNNGVEVSGIRAQENEIRRNRISGNGAGAPNRGIRLTNSANAGRNAPTLVSSAPPGGLSFPAARIDLFADTSDQGMLYIGSTTASGDGTWVSGALDLVPYQGLNLTATATDNDGNTSEFSTNSIQVPDVTPPVISVLGTDPLPVECGDFSPDLMFEAIDNADGDISGDVIITVQDSTVSNAVQNPGTYLVRFDVSDAAGNAAVQVSRTVEVVDTTPPTLTLQGPLELEVGCFESYVDPGATATDTCDTNVDISVVVDTTVAGEQTVFVTATDNFGNTDTKTRTLIVGGAASSDIFVANNGVDVAAGGTELAPFQTIGYAMAQAECLAAADNIVTITLAPGIYPEVVRFAPYTRLIGAGEDSTIIQPSASAIDAVVGDVAITGANMSTLERLAVEIPTNAPSATRIVFIDDVSMLVRKVRITGTSQQTDSVGIAVTEPGSSATRVVRSIIENVNSGVLAVQTNARFGLNVLRDIKEIGVLVEPPNKGGEEGEAVGETPVFGNENELQSTGSNTFEEFGPNATFIVNNSDEEMLAQYNDWDGLTEEGDIAEFIQGEVVFSPVLQANAVFLSTVVIEVLEQNQPLTGASVSTVPGVNVNATESQAGVYVFSAMPSGLFSFLIEKPGYSDRVLVLTVDDVLVSAVTEMAPEDGGPGGLGAHSADLNGNSAVDLSELLRVVQLYNVTSFSCQEGTEDGFTLGPGDRTCDLHSADYQAPQWKLTLSEVLRVLQLFNSGGFTVCSGTTEDGFCPNGG